MLQYSTRLTLQVKHASSEAFCATIHANDVLFRHIFGPATEADQALSGLVSADDQPDTTDQIPYVYN